MPPPKKALLRLCGFRFKTYANVGFARTVEILPEREAFENYRFHWSFTFISPPAMSWHRDCNESGCGAEN
jgi:hypothetical protein